MFNNYHSIRNKFIFLYAVSYEKNGHKEEVTYNFKENALELFNKLYKDEAVINLKLFEIGTYPLNITDRYIKAKGLDKNRKVFATTNKNTTPLRYAVISHLKNYTFVGFRYDNFKQARKCYDETIQLNKDTHSNAEVDFYKIDDYGFYKIIDMEDMER